MRDLFERLNSAYKAPERQLFSGPLLDEIYGQIKEETEKVSQTQYVLFSKVANT